jgi:hypothetical protein
LFKIAIHSHTGSFLGIFPCTTYICIITQTGSFPVFFSFLHWVILRRSLHSLWP